MTRGIAVLGAGMVGAAHAAAYRAYLPRHLGAAPDLALVSVCDVRPEVAASVAARYGFAEAASDWRAVLGDDRVGLVSVALPNAEHEEVVLAALAAGKHVLCEKPLALSAVAARRMADAAARAGVVACTMFNYRRMPAIAGAVERVTGGDIGTPVALHMAYRAEYAADPRLPYSWRYDRAAAGGGAIVDLGTHAIDLALALCGPVATVIGALERTVIAERLVPRSAASGHGHAELGDERCSVDTDDVFSALVRFTSGCDGFVSASRVAVGYGNALAFEVSGTSGSIRFDSERPNCYDVAVWRLDVASHFQRVHVGASSPYVADHLPVPHDGVTVGYAEAFGFAVADFLDAVVMGSPVVNGSFEDGARAAAVIEAMQEAARRGEPVEVEAGL